MGTYTGGYAGQRDDLHPGQDRADSTRFYHTTQNSVQFKTYKLYVSGIFHLIFSDHS